MPSNHPNRLNRAPKARFHDFTSSSPNGNLLWAGFRLADSQSAKRTRISWNLFGKLRIKGPQ